MTVDQLHDAIGMLPADLLAEAEQKRTQTPKALPIRRYAALAASVAVLLCGVWIYCLVGMGPGNTESTMNTVKTESAALNSSLEEDCITRGDSGSDSAPEAAAGAVQSQTVAGSLSQIPALELRWGSSCAVLSPDQYSPEEDAGAASSDRAKGLTADLDSLPTLTLEDGPLLLHWPVPPEELEIWYWSEEEPQPIPSELQDGKLTLPAGHWFCQIAAQWGQEAARYTFRAICP